VALSDEDVREILRIVDESGLDELRIDVPGLYLHVRRGGEPLPAMAPAAAATAAPAAVPAEPEPGGPTIDAPMLGTFYRAPAPGEPPYVEIGTAVEPSTVVCLIEVMKMMNSVQAGAAGVVAEVCAENAALVEFGQPLFRLEPAA